MYCPQKKCECFLFANENSPRNTPFFLDRLKRLLVVQIPENTVYQENAEHIRLINFHWQSETVEMGGTCLGEQKSIQQKVVFNSWKLYYHTEDTFTRNCIQGFSIFEGMKKFYYRRSAKKCIKYSFDSRGHLKTGRRLCFPTTDCLETSSPPHRPGLDNFTSQPWSHANCPRRTSDSAYFTFVTLFQSKTTRQSTKAVARGQVVSDHGWLVILSRPGRSGEDEPGLEVIRGREP